MNTPLLQKSIFLSLLFVITLAFAWVLTPFFGPILWAVIMAVLFNGAHKRILRKLKPSLRGRRNIAALLTLLICIVVVLLPAAFLAISLVREASSLVEAVRMGQLDFRSYAGQIQAALPNLPAWATDILARFDLVSVNGIVERFSDGFIKIGQALTGQALSIGQNALIFVVNLVIMLYLLFFFLRDGGEIAKVLRNSAPMQRSHIFYLIDKFTTVVRATVKGNIAVAMVQGTLGGLAFWVLDIRGAMLWGVVMAVLSLLPAVGASLVWGPVAIYLLATGATFSGVGLVIWGALVIGMVDNVLRPVLVGKDTKLPDYIVLLSTLGGISIFGLSGFVVGPVIAALFMAFWALFERENSDFIK